MTTKKTSSKLIVSGGQGNPRQRAAQTSYTPLNTKQEAIRKLARAKLKRSGSNGSTTTSSVSSARGVAQSPLYYDPRHSTPDKFHFPRDRATANSIWKDMYRTDTCTAISTDMYADMPWSEFRLQGIEDKKIKQIYEDMFSDLNLVPKLPTITRDYIITGELILHAIFNASKGYWDQVISHNPDYVKVQGIGITSTQPLLWLKPTSEIKKLVSSPDPRVRKYVNTLPKEIVMAFRSNKEIPLDALNTTYIPRKEVSYDVRGTSMYTRLYRYNMYEDFIVNASLAIAQRNAAPTRLVKIGDKEGNWMPTDDDIDSMIELFSLAESDPFAAVFTHPYVEVEYVGVSDRVLLISREWEFIERAKLLAMGISKSFLIGETSFACFEEGTPVLMGDGSPKNIEDIENGDIVIDQHGKQSKVANNWCEGTPENLLGVSVWGGHNTFRVTPNHRFPAWMWPTECECGCKGKIKTAGRRFVNQKHAASVNKYGKNRVPCKAMVHHGRHRIDYLPEGYDPERTVEARELRKGDFLKIPRTYSLVENQDSKIVDPDLARLLGYYLAEGSLHYGKSAKGEKTQACEMRLSFGSHEEHTWAADVVEICKKFSIRSEVAYWKKSVCTVRVIPKDKDFLKWICSCAGERSFSKKLSEEVLTWPDMLLKELLKGYIRGDGCRNDRPSPSQVANRNAKTSATVQVGTVSEVLATQIILVLARLGFPAGHAITKPNRKVYDRKPYHILRIQGKAAIDLCSMVWDEVLDAKYHQSTPWYDDEFMYLPIRSIKEVENTKPVYNLEVEGDHTYLICDGIATHNSAIAGLQVLMNRLNSLRELIENEWIIQKLCIPVAEMNEFYKAPSRAELEHRIRIKKPEERELVIPSLKWKKGLETTLDTAVLGVWQNLYTEGFLSERTYASGAGVDLDIERKNLTEERKYKEEQADELGIPVEQPAGEPGADMGGGLPFGSSNGNPYKLKSAQDDIMRMADKKGKVYIEDAMSILSKMNSSEARHTLTKIQKSHPGKDLNMLVGS